MKLAILVAYRVSEAMQPLLELHLRQIAELTRVPYVLYGIDCGLAEGLRPLVEQAPNAQLLAAPKTDLTGTPEAALYLEILTRRAIADGASHCVTLHPDSFPVRPHWVERLAAHLSDTCPMVTLSRVHTACLLFTREFYLDRRPRYLPTDAERASPLYQSYLRQFQAADHSGDGYGLAALRAGLTWHNLPCRRLSELEETYAGLFGETIFHIGKMVRAEQLGALSRDASAAALPRAYLPVRTLYRRLLPARVRRALRSRFPELGDRLVVAPRQAAIREHFSRAYHLACDDPQAFLDLLQTAPEPGDQRPSQGG